MKPDEADLAKKEREKQQTEQARAILRKHAETVKLSGPILDLDSFEWFPISRRFLLAVVEINRSWLDDRPSLRKVLNRFIEYWGEASRPHLPAGVSDVDLARMMWVNVKATEQAESDLPGMVAAAKTDSPPVSMVNEDDDLKWLACFFRRLQQWHLALGHPSFYMTFEMAGKLFGQTWSVMRGRMHALEDIGVLVCTDRAPRGRRGKGSHYRFVEEPPVAPKEKK